MVGKKIRELRQGQNLSQEEFGQKILHTKSTISKWENGSSVPDFLTLQKISEIFNVDISYFVGKTAKENNQMSIKVIDSKLITTINKSNYSGLLNLPPNKKRKWIMVSIWSSALVLGTIFFGLAFKDLPEMSKTNIIFLITGLAVFCSGIMFAAIHFRLSDIWAKQERINAKCKIFTNKLEVINIKTNTIKEIQFNEIINISKNHYKNMLDLYVDLNNAKKITLFNVDGSIENFLKNKWKDKNYE